MELVCKNMPANAGDVREVGCDPGWGRFPGREWHSILQNSLHAEICGERGLGNFNP